VHTQTHTCVFEVGAAKCPRPCTPTILVSLNTFLTHFSRLATLDTFLTHVNFPALFRVPLTFHFSLKQNLTHTHIRTHTNTHKHTQTHT